METSISMEHSPFWEATRFLANLEIHRILWNQKSNYQMH